MIILHIRGTQHRILSCHCCLFLPLSLPKYSLLCLCSYAHLCSWLSKLEEKGSKYLHCIIYTPHSKTERHCLFSHMEKVRLRSFLKLSQVHRAESQSQLCWLQSLLSFHNTMLFHRWRAFLTYHTSLSLLTHSNKILVEKYVCFHCYVTALHFSITSEMRSIFWAFFLTCSL